MAIPGSVWLAETHHKGIWQSSGLCVRCQVAPRDMLCSRCMEPMCAKCLAAHTSGMDHARDRYIERLARAKDSLAWIGATKEERKEARAVQHKWAEDERALRKVRRPRAIALAASSSNTP